MSALQSNSRWSGTFWKINRSGLGPSWEPQRVGWGRWEVVGPGPWLLPEFLQLVCWELPLCREAGYGRRATPSPSGRQLLPGPPASQPPRRPVWGKKNTWNPADPRAAPAGRAAEHPFADTAPGSAPFSPAVTARTHRSSGLGSPRAVPRRGGAGRRGPGPGPGRHLGAAGRQGGLGRLREAAPARCSPPRRASLPGLAQAKRFAQSLLPAGHVWLTGVRLQGEGRAPPVRCPVLRSLRPWSRLTSWPKQELQVWRKTCWGNS